MECTHLICHRKDWKRINVMRPLKFTLDRRSLESIHLYFIRPLLAYGGVIFDNIINFIHNKLDIIQNEAARIVTGTTKLTFVEHLFTDTRWHLLGNRRTWMLTYKTIYNLPPATCTVCYQNIIMLVILNVTLHISVILLQGRIYFTTHIFHPR